MKVKDNSEIRKIEITIDLQIAMKSVAIESLNC